MVNTQLSLLAPKEPALSLLDTIPSWVVHVSVSARARHHMSALHVRPLAGGLLARARYAHAQASLQRFCSSGPQRCLLGTGSDAPGAERRHTTSFQV